MKLIIINGPSGVGKTTLSSELVKSYPLSVHLDIDSVRHLITDFRTYREQSSILAFDLALAIVRKSLENGCDVVIDKVLYNHDDAPRQYLEEFLVIGEEFGAEIHEFILTADRDTVIQRAQRRGFHPEGPMTPEKVELFYEEVELYSKKRPSATIFDTTDISPQELLQKIITQINE